jgi:hypothetical protein
MNARTTYRSPKRTLISLIAAAALLAVAAPAAGAAKGVPYKGKTTGGHTLTFKLDKRTMNSFVTGVPTTCLSIQGGGAPITGAEVWNFDRVRLGLRNFKFSEQSKPTFHYNEVTRNHTVTTRRARSGKISGSIRVQYSFLIPKYPIGTFSIYSCLGNTKFSARPARR